MSVGKYIKILSSDSIIYGISGVTTRFIGIFLIPLYTRFFPPSEYGLIAIITAYIGFLNMFVFGLDYASTISYYETGEDQQKKSVIASWFWYQAALGFILATLTLIFSENISGLLLGSTDKAILVKLSGLTLFLAIFGKVLSQWLLFQRRPWFMTTFSLLSSVGTILVIIAFVLVYRKGLIGLYLAQLIAAGIIALLVIFVLRSWINPRIVTLPQLKKLLVLGLPVIPASIASWATASADRFILKIYYSTSEIGIYALAVMVGSGVIFITTGFQSAWSPFAFSIQNEPDSKQVYSKVFSLYCFFGCWFGTVLSLFTPALLLLFTTPQYYSATSCVPYLVFANLAIGVSHIIGIGSAIVKNTKSLARSLWIGAIINTVVNFALIPFWGKIGASISTLVAYASAAGYLYIVSQNLYPIPYRFKDLIVCSMISFLLIGLDRLFLPFASLTAFTIRFFLSLLFIPLAFWLGILKKDHLKRFLQFCSVKRHKTQVYAGEN